MPLAPDGAYEDSFEDNIYRKLFTTAQIKIDGIHSFGMQHLKLNEGIPPHYHKNCFEIHYMVQGSLSFEVGGERYTMKDGDIFVTFPNEMHKGDGNNTLVRKMFWFTVEDNETLLGLSPEWSEYIMKSLHGIKNRVIPIGSGLKSYFEQILLRISSQSEMDKIYSSALMSAVLCRIIECDRLPVSRDISPEIKTAVDFIENNKNHGISLDEVAESCHLSLSHFKSRFKNETGITPALYIQKKRIECSKELLRAGHSVTETAYLLDFGSSNYFSVVFRRITFMTPTQYIASVCTEKF